MPNRRLMRPLNRNANSRGYIAKSEQSRCDRGANKHDLTNGHPPFVMNAAIATEAVRYAG